MSFSKNIRALRYANHLSQAQLAESLGYRSFTTIQKWEDGTSSPSYAVLEKLSEIFKTTPAKLMSDEASYAPVLGIVAGGSPIYANQEVLGYEAVSLDLPSGSEYFYLKVVGDSMKDARILPGDLLYVHAQENLDNGQIGVILVDDEATVKRFYQENGIVTLKPANSSFKPLVFDEKEFKQHQVKILGKVIANKIAY